MIHLSSRTAMTKQKRQSRTKLFLKRFSKQKYIFMLVVPGVIWFIVFKYYPLRFIINAFTNYGTVANPRFTGLANFQRLFLSPNFWRAFRNTLILSFYNIVFYFPIPIILALSLNELKNQFAKKAAQFVIYIPHFLSWVVVGGLFNMMLAPSDGIINKALVSMDAAAVDGAGYWARTWHVTLPDIRNTIATVLLLTLSRVMQMFEQILVMYNSAVMDVSDVLRTFSYVEVLNRGNVGYATAIGLFTSIVSVLLILGCNLFSKKVLDEEII